MYVPVCSFMFDERKIKLKKKKEKGDYPMNATGGEPQEGLSGLSYCKQQSQVTGPREVM